MANQIVNQTARHMANLLVSLMSKKIEDSRKSDLLAPNGARQVPIL